jgi:hypothetical protein
MLAKFGLRSDDSKSGIMTREEFTREFAELLRQERPELKVAIVGDLELKVTSADGRDSSTFLDNAYNIYKQDPQARAEVVRRFVAASLETAGVSQSPVDRTRVVPVIKDRPWLEETRQALLSRGAKELPEHVFDDFTADLIIVYAEDLPHNIRYLTPADLGKAGIERGG